MTSSLCNELDSSDSDISSNPSVGSTVKTTGATLPGEPLEEDLGQIQG